jgi:transcriptional regulator with XRE-family HTH domain
MGWGNAMTSAQPAAFGELLKHYRLAAGLTQEALAERAGLSARSISDMERGLRRAPYQDSVGKLAQALGLSDAGRAQLEAAARRRSAPRLPRSAGTPASEPLPSPEMPTAEASPAVAAPIPDSGMGAPGETLGAPPPLVSHSVADRAS